MSNETDKQTAGDYRNSIQTPCSTEFFHTGDEKRDVAGLLDMAIDIIEIWNVEKSPYNQRLKRCWMKRAQELGANKHW